MKKNMMFLAALLLAACTAKIDPETTPAPDPDAGKPTVKFTFEAENVTRTTLDEALDVVWTAGDKIAVFSGTTSTPFTADATGKSSTFTGEEPAAAEVYYALYPYNPHGIEATISGNVITTVIPNYQVGVAGGFDPRAQVMVGRSTDGTFQMKNAVSLVKVEIAATDITYITLASNSGTQGLAGKTVITVGSDGIPSTIAAEAKSVLMVPSGDTFAAGTYYIAVAPGTVTGGIKVLMTKSTDDNIYSVSSDAACTLTRSKVTALKNVESKLVATTVSQKVTVVFSDGTAWKSPFFWGDDGTAVDNYSAADSSIPGSSASAGFAGVDRAFYVRNTAPNTNGYWLQLNVFAETGLWRNTKQGFCFGRDAGDYMALPARNNGRLIAVAYKPGTASYQGYPSITTEAGVVVNGGDAYQFKSTATKTIYWHNLDAANGVRYRITTQPPVNAGSGVNTVAMQELYLYYAFDSNVATPANAKTQPETVLGTSVTLNGACNRWQSGNWSSYTAGFEYKAASADWGTATNVDVGTLSGATWSTTLDLPAGNYSYRAWVQSGTVKYYGNGHDFEVEDAGVVDPEYTLDFSTYSTTFRLFEPAGGYTGTGNPPWSDIVDVEVPFVSLDVQHNTVILNEHSSNASPNRGYRNVSSALGLARAITGTYFKLPAINGLRLEKVIVNYASCGNLASMSLTYADGSDVPGVPAQTAAKSGALTFTLDNSEPAGAVYKLNYIDDNATAKYNPQFQSIVLTYKGTEASTVQFVCPPAFNAGTISADVYVDTVCKDSDLSGGFRYKAGGVGDWVNLGAAGFTAISSGITTASVSRSVNAGDVVQAWASDGTKTVYSPEVTIE